MLVLSNNTHKEDQFEYNPSAPIPSFQLIFSSNVIVKMKLGRYCSQTIEKTLLRNKSTGNVQVTFQSGKVHIEVKAGQKVNQEQIRGAIRQAGFIPGVEQFG